MTNRKCIDIYFTYLKHNEKRRGFSIIHDFDKDTIEERIEKLKQKYKEITDIEIVESEYTMI